MHHSRYSARLTVSMASAVTVGLLGGVSVDAREMHIGVEGGVAVSTMDASRGVRLTFAYSRVAPCVGLTFDLDLDRYLVLGTGLRYATRGYSRNLMPDSGTIAGDVDAWSYTLSAKRDYLEIPLTVHVRMPFDFPLRPYMSVGIALSLNVRAEDQLTLITEQYASQDPQSGIWESGEIRSEAEVNLRDSAGFSGRYHVVDVPLEVGLGMDIHLKQKVRLRIAARYSLGLVSFTAAKEADKDLRYTVETSELPAGEIERYEEFYGTLQFEAGVAMPIRRRGRAAGKAP